MRRRVIGWSSRARRSSGTAADAVLAVEGPDGSPPFLVRWEDDGHESLVFPGPDAHVATDAATST